MRKLIHHSRFAIGLAATIPLLLVSGCSAVQLVNAVSKIYPVEKISDISFGPNPRDTLDLYLPRDTDNEQEIPVIVFYYGGSWNRGEKSEYEFVGRRLASLGYAVSIPNYRVYPEVKYPDFLVDSAKGFKATVTELNKETYANQKFAKQFILMGHSAGAYNASMLAYDPTWLQNQNVNPKEHIAGLIGMAGAYNIYPIKVTEVQPVFDHPNYPPNSQPIEFVDNANFPTLLIAPANDELVSIEKNTNSLAKALKDSGKKVEVKTVNGTDHISLIGTLSPLLFFKGSSVDPIKQFVSNVSTQ